MADAQRTVGFVSLYLVEMCARVIADARDQLAARAR
jgi:hypothetical protein